MSLGKRVCAGTEALGVDLRPEAKGLRALVKDRAKVVGREGDERFLLALRLLGLKEGTYAREGLIPCASSLRAWEESGIWERIWRLLLARLDEQGKLQWARAFLDGSFVAAKKGELASAKLSAARAQRRCS